jgi:hypothetical protein
MGASVTLQERSVAVEPGGEATLDVRVRNAGQVVDQFSIQVLGDAAAWAIVEPPALSLFPGAEEPVTVRFRPPRTSAVAAGQVPFGIRVVSHEDQGAAVEEGTVAVAAFQQTTADLVPTTSRGSRSGLHQLAVDNRGNVPIQVGVSGFDQDAALRFGFSPPGLQVAPGRAGFTQVRVRPRRTFLTGTPRNLPFQLQVASAGEAPIAIAGQMVQGPLISRVLRNVAIGAVALVVAGALLWFLALKPGIQSTAKDAVAVPLAQQSAAIAKLQQQAAAGGGQQRPGGAATPTPAVSGSGGGASAGSGQPFARRLDQSGGGHNQYRVPAGITLSITDLVFQNPGAEHGTVSLQREGTSLFVENLDNFRDLDYHVVTPITATANQTIQMSVQCPTGCPSVGIFLNGTERPS